MVNAMIAEFANMAVPFFGTRPGFIREDDAGPSRDKTEIDDQKDFVTESELLALRRRMIDLLQDLCKE
jgi:Protein of unknown function (DUF2458)